MYEIVSEAGTVLSIISNGISILKAGRGAFGKITAHTGFFTIKRNRESPKSNLYDEFIRGYKSVSLGRDTNFIHEQELYKQNNSGIIVPTTPNIIEPCLEEINEFKHIHNSRFTESICFSSMQDLPRGFLPEFEANPDDFIYFKQEIGSGEPPLHHLRDASLIPVEFLDNGRSMVGFMKVGFIKMFFNVTYKSLLSEFTIINISKDPYINRHMSRNEPCYCQSGRRFKHCHGSFANVDFNHEIT